MKFDLSVGQASILTISLLITWMQCITSIGLMIAGSASHCYSQVAVNCPTWLLWLPGVPSHLREYAEWHEYMVG
jgi:hypothetical protein